MYHTYNVTQGIIYCFIVVTLDDSLDPLTQNIPSAAPSNT